MDGIQKTQPKTPNLFYTKPYINCEECLHTPLKCKNCLMAMMHRRKPTETPKAHPIQFLLPQKIIQLHRVKKPLNFKYSLKDAIGTIPKTRKNNEKPSEIQKMLKDPSEIQQMHEQPHKMNDFFPKLPQKIFNHKYFILPEGKRKVLPNFGTGTEIFIKLKETIKKRNNHFEKRRNEEKKGLFYREKK